MSEEKEESPMLIWHDCDEDCGFTDIFNGECECYNAEMNKREEKAPC